MISERPWGYGGTSFAHGEVPHMRIYAKRKEGMQSGPQVTDWMAADDARHIVACVNAFHESRIDPADLPKFVEAVRLRAKVASNWGAKAICQTTNIECDKAFRNAAACLPENKEPKHD